MKRIKSNLPYQAVIMDEKGEYLCSVWTHDIDSLTDFCIFKNYTYKGERRCEFDPKKGCFTEMNMNNLERYL